MFSKRLFVLVLMLAAFAAVSMAADAACPAVTGQYVIRLGGFGGGAPNFYPIALIGTITVGESGDVKGSYKQFAALAGGVQVNRTFTGTMKIKDCAGTLEVKDAIRTTHTFTVLVGKDGALTMAIGDVGLILSGEGRQ